MTYKTFVDGVGQVWSVWEVRPTYLDRRSGVDRRAQARHTPDRRVRAVPGAPLGAVQDDGWLCFARDSEDDPRSGEWVEKRRLSPVPGGWEAMDDAALSRLCEQAVLTRPSGGIRR
jgi:hypothetical protein